MSEETKRRISAALKGRPVKMPEGFGQGSRNANYRHGRLVRPINSKKWHKVWDAARARDVVCQLCFTDKQLTVHHMDGNGSHHALDNAITLCRACHAMVHGIARRWRRMDLAVVLVGKLRA